MNTLLLVFIAFIGYVLAYNIYGRYIARKLFKLDNNHRMPSEEFYDGIDFVPTKKHIIFGHHFTTIAGLGPIVGPAIGVIWGWLPALLWVFFGSIFMGAVHDFTSLIVSSRNKGLTIGELTGNIISPSTRYVFQFIMQFLLLIVLSVFTLIVSKLFTMYPEAVLPVWLQIPIAVWLGWQIRKGKNDLVYSIIAVILMYVTVIVGAYFPVVLPPLFGSPGAIWCIILLVYVYFASTIPVHKLLQPRDYINSHQLLIAMALLIIGLLIAHPKISAPPINPEAFTEQSDVPSLMPLLFITIACGAISGFHSLASSGTSVKQIAKEKDTLFIGYGGMILESFLAVLVIMAIIGGLGIELVKDGLTFYGEDAFFYHYSSYASASGLGAKLEAFVVGSANLFASFGIPKNIGVAMIAVFIVSFANTTLDSATRIQRLSLQEIISINDVTVFKSMKNRYVATLIVVGAAAILVFLKQGAALFLWPLFGALNQLLAALALGVVTVYLYTRKKNIYYTAIPMFFILIITIWAMILNIINFVQKNDILLTVLSVIIIILTVWLLISGTAAIFKKSDFKT